MDTSLIPIAVAVCAWLALMWQANRLRGQRVALDDAAKAMDGRSGSGGGGAGGSGTVVYIMRRHYSYWDIRALRRRVLR